MTLYLIKQILHQIHVYKIKNYTYSETFSLYKGVEKQIWHEDVSHSTVPVQSSTNEEHDAPDLAHSQPRPIATGQGSCKP